MFINKELLLVYLMWLELKMLTTLQTSATMRSLARVRLTFNTIVLDVNRTATTII